MEKLISIYMVGDNIMNTILIKKTCSINDVANYFLSKEHMTPKKLQKMCYYAYSWYLTLYEEHLFEDGKFEAWVHGPVNSKLYQKYKVYRWREITESEDYKLSDKIKEFLDIILNTFSRFSGDQLESMTHQELPWIEARRGCEPDEVCKNILSDDTIKSFYGEMMEHVQGE